MSREENAIEMENLSAPNSKDGNTNSSDVKERSKCQFAVQLLSGMSISGLNRAAATSSTPLRLFWTCLFFLGFIGFTYNLIAIIQRFVDSPILTQTKHEYKEFTWPHFTFCNPSNPIPFWKMPELKIKWKQLIDKAKRHPTMFYNATQLLEMEILEQYLAMSSLRPHEFYNVSAESVIFQMRIFIQDEDMVASSSGDLDQFVRVKNIGNYFIGQIGSSRIPLLCFTLFPERLAIFDKRVQKPSDVSSIRLNLLMDRSSYRYYNFGYERRKMKLYISQPESTLSTSSVFPIYAGSDSQFVITERFLHRQVECADHKVVVELYDSQFSSSRAYLGGYEDCRQYLSQGLFLEKCKCHNPFLPIYKLSDEKPRLCLNMSIFSVDEIAKNVKCMNNVTHYYKTDVWFKDALKKHCSKYLISNCKQTSYNVVRNTIHWNLDMNQDREKRMKRAIKGLPNSPPNASEDFLLFNMATIQFQRKTQRTSGDFEEFEYPAPQFLSDVGGILGLWLGLGVINIFELFEFLAILAFVRKIDKFL